MNVNELKALLEKMPDDTEVYFSYEYGDHVNSTLCDSVDEAEMKVIKWSNYHDAFKVEDEDSEIESDNVRRKHVLVLQSY